LPSDKGSFMTRASRNLRMPEKNNRNYISRKNMGHPWTSPINIYIYGVFNGKKSSTNDYKCEIFHRHKNDFRRIKAAHPSKVWQLSMIENKHEKPLHNSPKSPKITLFCMSNNTNTSINNHRYINNHNIYIYTVYIYI
jgi:hypothetical protein